jgi:aryl-alcohol dehydrogenase-like predicted oxidoreductase
MHSVEASLRRLKTDYIDLYQVHRPDDLTDIAETMSALTDVVRQGKVRMIGCCTYPASLQVEAHWASERYGYERLTSNQPPYSILTRGIEFDSLPISQKYGMGVITWSPLASGWLTGRMRRGQPIPPSPRWDAEINRPRLEGMHASPGRYRDLLDPTSTDNPMVQRKLDVVEQLIAVAEAAGITMVDLALGFILAHPAVTSAIIGPRTMEQLQGQLQSADVRLSDDVLDRIDRIVPPGTNLNPAEAGYQPPSITQAARRRRRA